MLKKTKFEEVCAKAVEINNFYSEDDNGFFRLKIGISSNERSMLKSLFEKVGFSALYFTDSRSKFSFYNLAFLWEHINILQDNNTSLAHMASEPVSAAEVFDALYGKSFLNELANPPFDYTFFKTKHFDLFHGKEGYIFSKDEILKDIELFIKNAE
jgi:hypothetical protein